jgi:small neutral amino acid transporter SnatA (MarC family)
LLLGFPALLSIVALLGEAFIFREVTAHRSRAGRALLARQVATYSLVVLIVAPMAVSYVLAFFRISLAALRVAGFGGGAQWMAPARQSAEAEGSQAGTSSGVQRRRRYRAIWPPVMLGAGDPRTFPGTV